MKTYGHLRRDVTCVYNHARDVIETDECKGARRVQQSVCHPS